MSVEPVRLVSGIDDMRLIRTPSLDRHHMLTTLNSTELKSAMLVRS